MPLSSKVSVLLGYAVASVVGGVTTGYLSPNTYVPAVLVGALFTLTNFVNMKKIPHPWWMSLISTFTFVPLSLFGLKLVGGPLPKLF